MKNFNHKVKKIFFLYHIIVIISCFNLFAQEKKESKTENSVYYKIPEAQRKGVGIKGLNQEATIKWRKYYLSDSNQSFLAEILYNSIPYRPYIVQELKKNKMPLCLQYLPIVESNYKITAVSPSGATGLWQFMENSMSPYMKKNWWFDERLDPWKETDAAISKLKENYKRFNDWAFALAAYNMGAGAISRIIKAHPGKDYWWLCKNGYIRKETADYVPKLLAIADIIQNAEYWGCIKIAACDKRMEFLKVRNFDYLKINKELKFEEISKITGIKLEEIKFLNPALIRNSTPPKTTWKLRLPKGTAKNAAEALKKYYKKK